MGMGNFDGANQAYLENHWKQVICKRICVEIGKRINFAGKDLAYLQNAFFDPRLSVLKAFAEVVETA